VRIREASTYTKLSCSREIFAVLVEADGHDAIRGIECLFNAIAMVNVNINV
jgi:hypothetical protein